MKKNHNGKKLRYEILGKVLVLDDIIQLSEHDNARYHETITHPVVQTVLPNHDESGDVLILGGGDGVIAAEVLKYPKLNVTLVDIDKEVVELSKKYLKDLNKGSLNSERVTIKNQDALKYVTETNKKYDVIFLDITDPHPDSPSSSLLGTEAIGRYKKLLKESGIIICQTDNPYITPKHREEIIQTFSENFINTDDFFITAITFSGLFSFVWASDKHKKLKFVDKTVQTSWLTQEKFTLCEKMLDLI